MNLSVVIPNYNGEDLLKKNLPKVFDAISLYKDGKVEVVIIDDCSTDNSINVLENLIPKIRKLLNLKVKIIRNERNLGFSPSINKGVKNAIGDILLLLNTDVIPEKNFLKPLLGHFSDPNIFAVGCMDKSIEGGKTILRGRGIGFWKRGFLMHSRGEVEKKNTLWVNGGSGAFRKNFWDKLGGFDELYSPFYWEDIDLSYRALKSGYKILFERKSIVIHEHEKGAIKKKFSSNYVNKIAYRNQFIFVWKNITDLSMQFEHFVWFPYYIILAFFRMDSSFFRGLIQAILVLPKILSSSFNCQKLFIRTDKKILDEFKNEK